jgi:hypothetical protein
MDLIKEGIILLFLISYYVALVFIALHFIIKFW